SVKRAVSLSLQMTVPGKRTEAFSFSSSILCSCLSAEQQYEMDVGRCASNVVCVFSILSRRLRRQRGTAA
ncbi:hypothetical protein CSUI_002505, partial [Cystoisospora suis]